MAFATELLGEVLEPKATPVGTSSRRTSRRNGGTTLRQRLRAFVVVGVVMVVAVAGAGLFAVGYVNSRTHQLNELGVAHTRMQQVGASANELRNNALRAMLASQGIVPMTQDEAEQTFLTHVTVLGTAMSEAQAMHLTGTVGRLIEEIIPQASAFAAQADQLVSRAFTDFLAATAALPAFDTLSADVVERQLAIRHELDALMDAERQRISDAQFQTALVLIGLIVASVLLLATCAFVLGRSLRRSLQRLGNVASSIAHGELGARASITTDDELGALGDAINDMATGLQVLVRRMEASAERDGFGSQLSEALEMADTEAEALQTIERAMSSISSGSPMEILLADSSKAHLARAASNPTAGAPCCPVESPFSCVAVRRGNPVVFENSEALNACPKLRGRASGPVSAVCVPVTFMGRALGVLHATGTVGAPFAADTVNQLTSLATQSGGRIGTVRSFERSQLQATTDGLTGLRNRRTLETELRAMLNDGLQLSLVMADLDHFKLLNDTYGHEAGDRALRLFSKALEVSLRDSDLAGRFGGEEFVIALPGASMSAAVEVLDRLRERLAASGDDSGQPSFTASFGVVDSSMGGSLEDLLRIADAALYRAKDEGRNRVTIADERDIAAAIRPDDRKPVAPVAPPRAYATVGAFQRAASLDDPMPEAFSNR